MASAGAAAFGSAGSLKLAPDWLAMTTIERAISTAGGVSWDSLNADYSLKADPRTFLAGEMLDWEAPTGGYLLQACFATGRAAAHGMLARLA